MRLFENRFENEKDEVAHIIIGLASSEMNREVFDSQIRELKHAYGDKIVDKVCKEYKDLISRLLK